MLATQPAEAKPLAYSHLTLLSETLCGLDHEALDSAIGTCLKFWV